MSWSHGTKSRHCVICGRPTVENQTRTPCCGAYVHVHHLCEWVRVRGTCPNCHQPLKEGMIDMSNMKMPTLKLANHEGGLKRDELQRNAVNYNKTSHQHTSQKPSFFYYNASLINGYNNRKPIIELVTHKLGLKRKETQNNASHQRIGYYFGRVHTRQTRDLYSDYI